MNENVKKFLIILIILVIAIIFILFIILNTIKNSEKTKVEETEYYAEEDIKIEPRNELIEIKEMYQYYNFLYYINNCLGLLKNNDIDNLTKIIYKSSNNVEQSEYLTNLIVNYENAKFYPEKLYQKDFDINHKIFLYNGKLLKDERISNCVIGVIINYENSSYQIMISNAINEIDFSKINYNIEKNNYNIFEYHYSEDEEICRYIFENLKFSIKYYPDEIYNRLNEEYKQKRFNNNIDNYRDYTYIMSDKIYGSKMIKFEIQNMGNDQYMYIVEDEYNNQYIFEDKADLNYTIMLDRHTVKDTIFKNKYANLDNDSKIDTNLKMFANMINTKDFVQAYDTLDEKFRNNNFPTLDSFKKYIIQNLFENNYINVDSIEEREDNIWIINTTINNNITADTESKSKTFIMKLDNDTEFKLSFELN